MITPNTPTTITGLFFGEDGKLFAYQISRAHFLEVVCHAMSGHGVNHAGGFYGGAGAVAAEGVAVGKDARTIDDNHNPIDAIQVGAGINNRPKTFKVYDKWIVLENGMINPDALPNQDGGTGGIIRDTLRTTEHTTVVKADNMVYIADATNNNVAFVLPDPATVQNMPFQFRLGSQASGYAMTIERSGDAKINVNGQEWLGITTDSVGFWFTLVAKGNNYHVVLDKGITVANNIT